MVKPKTYFEQVPLAMVKKAIAIERDDRVAHVSPVLCAICEVPVKLERCKIDEDGEPVHDTCYVKKLVERTPSKRR